MKSAARGKEAYSWTVKAWRNILAAYGALFHRLWWGTLERARRVREAHSWTVMP